MEPTLLSAAVVALLVLIAVVALGLRRRLRSQRAAQVVFDLRLPNKWAAELTGQTLMTNGIRSHLAPSGTDWLCRVKSPGGNRGQVETLCRRLDQIAAARGGGCAAHHVTVRGETRTFEH